MHVLTVSVHTNWMSAYVSVWIGVQMPFAVTSSANKCIKLHVKVKYPFLKLCSPLWTYKLIFSGGNSLIIKGKAEPSNKEECYGSTVVLLCRVERMCVFIHIIPYISYVGIYVL